MPTPFRTWCTHSLRSKEVVPSRNQKSPTAAPRVTPIDSQKNTALVPSLSQFARISEPQITSDQTRGVCLLCAIVFHPFELVFGLHLGLRDRAVLACRSERPDDVPGFQYRFAQAPVGRRNRPLQR